MYALNARTGALLWSYTTDDLVESSPAVSNGVVYVGSWGGTVYALNAKTSALLWSYYIGAGDPQFSSPAVANGVVYIGADDRRAFALNARTGADRHWILPKEPVLHSWRFACRNENVREFQSPTRKLMP